MYTAAWIVFHSFLLNYIVWTYILFIHSPDDGHLGGLHLLIIVNSAAVNICV